MIERVTEFNFLGLTINEFMNWNSHASKISNKISRTLGVMNRLKRYLPLSAMKLMYGSLILSHLQFSISCWEFEWERLSKLQTCVVKIMTNSKYNAHSDPLFKIYWKLRTSLLCNAWKSGINLWTIMCQPTLLPCLDTTVNCTTFKPEATSFYIYFRFVLPMPEMPSDIEFPNNYVNTQLLS